MTALIFGASGQTGHYLAEACRARGMEVVGVSRSGPDVRGDVADGALVAALVRRHSPTHVFHLAAESTTRHEALLRNHGTIATGALHVLEAVRVTRPDARVFLAGSGVQFVNTGAPISEHAPFAASSAYAVARIHAAYAARYYRSLGVRAYVGFLFHHESPLRKPSHVSQIVALAARGLVRGRREPLVLGDVSVEKEWTFAGDVANAILTLVEQDRVFEAAIGSGEAHPIRAWAEACFAVAGADWREHVREAEGFVPEYRRLVSDPTTIRALGWAPRVGLSELARMMVSGADPALAGGVGAR
jgi:GDPmannose 4,6-dehydratase